LKEMNPAYPGIEDYLDHFTSQGTDSA